MPINLPDLRLGLRQVNTGNAPNDGLGDDLRTAFDKFNFNMGVLASMTNEAITSARVYWVAGTGSDTANNGLLQATPFKTIGKAVQTIYESLNLRGQQAIINVLPGDYVESVSLNSLPVGGYTGIPILIRKAPGQAGTVYWSLDTATMTACLTLNNGASVQVDDVHFRTLVTGADSKNYIRVLNNSTLYLGNCEFGILGANTLTNAVQILVEGYSEVQILKSYALSGGGTTHIYLKDGSFLWSPPTVGDPKLVTVAGTVEFQEVFRLTGRSDLRLSSTTLIQYQGNLQAKRFRSDFFSKVELGESVLPASTTVETYDAITLPGAITFNGQITSATNLTSLGSATFQGANTFNGTASFNAAATFASTVAFQSGVTAPTPPIEDNSTKVATTNFVQEVVEDKIVDSLAIATPLLFGLVKIDSAHPDPVVYRKPVVDDLLAAKANINSPTFTGTPQAPTPAGGDNSTNIATTAWVRGQLAGISAIPVGTIVPYAGRVATIPTGWLLCDGSYVSRTTYSALFAVLNTYWGSTDGTNFRLPPLVDRGLMGATNDAAVGQLAGSATSTIATTNLPAHNHNILDPGHTHSVSDPGHTHGFIDPGHVHVVNDPGHGHVCDTNRTLLGDYPPSLNWNDDGNGISLHGTIQAYANVTGVYLDRAYTGIQIVGNVSHVSVITSGTGITTQNTGSGTPLNILNPHAKVHYIIKA